MKKLLLLLLTCAGLQAQVATPPIEFGNWPILNSIFSLTDPNTTNQVVAWDDSLNKYVWVTRPAAYFSGGTDVPVADGGIGVSSLTVYAPIFGGTTTTNPVQSGTVGTAGEVLTSNGAGALPTFQAAAGGGAPTGAKYIVQEAHASLSAEQSLGALTTGLLLNTVSGSVGTLSKATEGTDYYGPAGTDVAVTDGGLGVSSLTAYAPIFGGTTSTTAAQSGTVGTAGQLLTSNGAGALPTFETLSKYAPGGTDVAVDDGGSGRSSATAYAPIFGGTTGTGAHQSGTVGSSGEVLTSNGAGALATFQAAPAGTGSYLGRQIITVGSGNYTPTSGTNSIVVKMVGAGAGGGGTTGAAASTGTAGGGGAGSYLEKRVTVVQSVYAYVVGAKGAGGANTGAVGANGNNTTFATNAGSTPASTTFTANGGTGGAFIASDNVSKAAAGGAGGAISTNGDLNTGGSPGQNGLKFTSNSSISGGGGSSQWGGGGVPKHQASSGASAGGNAVGYGAGGSGAATNANTAAAGGDGADGLIIVEEYK